MIEMGNIVTILVKGIMYNHFDCLKVYKSMNLLNIVVMLVNKLLMHYTSTMTTWKIC